jgi:hypothetical protein
MLNRIAVATSLAVLSGISYLLFYVLAVIWRDGFRFLFNAQFFGGHRVAPASRAVVHGIRRHRGRGDCEWLGVRLLLGVALQPAFALPELRRYCLRITPI